MKEVSWEIVQQNNRILIDNNKLENRAEYL
jgi:hypothetical protein